MDVSNEWQEIREKLVIQGVAEHLVDKTLLGCGCEVCRAMGLHFPPPRFYGVSVVEMLEGVKNGQYSRE